MQLLKGIGYTLAAILVLAVLLSVGALLSAIALASGTFLMGALVVALVAYCIKEYCESEPDRKSSGEAKGSNEVP